MTKKEVTTDELARMVKKGFDHVDDRFKEVNSRLDAIEFLLKAQYAKRVERLEKDVQRLKEVFAL